MPKLTRTILFALFLFSSLALTACVGGSQLTATSWPGVTVTASNVYVSFGNHVYSLDAADGDEVWRFPEEADNDRSFFAAPAITADGSRLIAGGYDNTVYSLDAGTGEPAGWTFTGASNRYIADVLIVDAAIFAANGDGSLYALDLEGNPLWPARYQTGEPIWGAPGQDGGMLFIASLDHHLHAVDMQTGERVWTRDFGTASSGVPVIVDGVLYTGTFGSRVLALDAATGDEIWSFETEDWVFASVAVADGLVYAGDVAGILYAIDAETGVEAWRFEAEGGIYGGPLVIDGIVHIGTDAGAFYAVGDGGELVWPYTVTGKIYSPARYNGEYIVIATIEGEALLTALDTNGDSRWTFTPEE